MAIVGGMRLALDPMPRIVERRPRHIAIYIGDGRYIHASSIAGRVVESSIDRPYSPLIKIWRGARRMLSLDDSAAAVAPIPTKGGAN